VNRGERLAALHYRARGYRVLDANVRVGGGELDLVLRRGRRIVIAEVKERSSDDFGGGLAAVDAEKRRRVTRAARAWLVSHPEIGDCDVRLEAVAVSGRRLQRRIFDPEESRG
jgi:putative endonuclease